MAQVVANGTATLGGNSTIYGDLDANSLTLGSGASVTGVTTTGTSADDFGTIAMTSGISFTAGGADQLCSGSGCTSLTLAPATYGDLTTGQGKTVGASAFDLIFGLLLGNLLAVLSWMLFKGPIATRARLTLYYQLEKICGRKLVILYNLANGVMFCFLAGAMVTVSATAVGCLVQVSHAWIKRPLPKQIGWVITVLVVGGLIAIVAAYGCKFVARFANIAAPWMILVFVAFGIVGLRQLGVTSLGDFWAQAQTIIWKGGDPLPGQVKFTFWHVMFFAWFR